MAAAATRDRRATAGGRACLAVLLAAVLLGTAAVGAAAQQPVIDAGLRSLLEPRVRAEIAAHQQIRPIAEPLPLSDTYAVTQDEAGRIIVGLLVQLREPAALDALRALGGVVGSVVGDIATVRLPLDVLDRVQDLALERVQVARILTTVHDSSMRAIRAELVRHRTDNGWTGSTGAGVIVGIIDTGIDIRHADFIDDAGNTRLLGVWDQTLAGTPPPGFTYGLHCTTDGIQQVIITGINATCRTVDGVGHGTHVAGSAAGNGASAQPAYSLAGVAPEASLLIVKAGDVSFSEDRVIDGLVWLKREAQARGLPAVVNLSLGHQFGPHDGSLPMEAVLDSLAGAAFIVVVAAGNQGANATAGETTPRQLIHARATATTAVARTVAIQIPPYTPSPVLCTGNVVGLSIFYDIRDRVQVTVVRPNGTSVTARAGQAARVEGNDAQGRIAIENAFPLAGFPVTGEAFVQLDGCGGAAPAPGEWRITMLPEPAAGGATGGPMDVWLHIVRLGSSGEAFGTTGFDNRYVVGAPGTARRAVTVGAFATRGCWPNQAGQTICYTQREVVGDLARFSSGGPTRDGRMKPEITAPGIGIVSVLSRHTNAASPRIAPGGRHWTLEGTSMATPHVAGAVALLLAVQPGLSPEDVVDIFSRSARQDAFTMRTYDVLSGAQPSDWWGFGKLDVSAALALVIGPGEITAVTVTPAADTIPQGATVQLRADAVDAAGRTVFAMIDWRSLEPAVATVDFTGRVRALQPGVARIVATAQDRADTAFITVQPPAVLIVAGQSAAPTAPALGRQGTILPLLALRLEADGPEDIELRAVGFHVRGADANARLILFDDPDGDGALSGGEQEIVNVRAPLAPAGQELILQTNTFLVPERGVRHLILAVQVSGEAPNAAAFSARLVPERIRTVNRRSGATDRVSAAGVIAADAATTLLREGELFVLSENPVRSGRVLFHFAAEPTQAAIYTVTGGLVLDFRARIEGLSFEWDLRNAGGTFVVPGVYLVMLRIDGRLVRQRLMVLAQE